jgi:hypothetical protein
MKPSTGEAEVAQLACRNVALQRFLHVHLETQPYMYLGTLPAHVFTLCFHGLT